MTQLGMSMDFGTKQVWRAERLSNMEAGPVGSGDVLGMDACKLPGSMACPVHPVIGDFVAHNPDLVSKDIRTFPRFEHQIKLSPEAVPVAVKTWPIPYAIADKVTNAVRLLDQQGIWEKADKRDWAHPMVTPVKPDGTVCITMDLSHLNKFVIPVQHLLHTLPESFQQV